MNTSNMPLPYYLKSSKNRKKNFVSFIHFFLLSYLFFGLFPRFAVGDTITNGNYSIDIGNIDTNPQPTTKPQQVLGVQSPKPEFTTGTDYTVNTSNDSFSIKISQNSVDYGVLSSTNPVIRISTISLSNPHFGSQILAYENNPLESLKKDIIQNTSCDNGACTVTTAALWNNTLTYGFGYRCDSQNSLVCDQQFSNQNYFKPYPNDLLDQSPEPIMDNYTNSSTTATVTYKVNISGTQKSAAYYNNIVYLAVPNF